MRAAFFDMDGCLVDSRAAISAAMNHALVQLGLEEQPVVELYRFIGPPLLRGFEELLADLSEDPRRAPEAVAAYRAVYGDLALALTRPAAGIPELLDDLPDEPRRVVVTSKPTEFAEPILAEVGLRSHFEDVYGPSLDALTERKAVKLEEALRAVGSAPGRPRSATVMIGDREHDIAAGKECGTLTVGVTWGIGDEAELREAGADLIVHRPDELGAVLHP